jgi:predicted nucleic acid-binding protein
VKILIDSNISLDVLLKREPNYLSSVKVLGLYKGGVEIFVSASSITDIYYIIRKEYGDKDAAINLIKKMLISVNVAAVTENEIRKAIELNWKDFEDAVQYSAGENIEADYIITRNKSDFSSSALPVVTPDEFLDIITKR